MTDTRSPANGDRGDRAFAAEAETRRPRLIIELWDFMVNNKKWWLIPIIVMLLLIGALIVVSATVAAPFIYPLF